VEGFIMLASLLSNTDRELSAIRKIGTWRP
jgi:hypothetical protein